MKIDILDLRQRDLQAVELALRLLMNHCEFLLNASKSKKSLPEEKLNLSFGIILVFALT
jgi:hypothetical protein